MLTTSPEFQTAVNAKARRFFPRIKINYTDVFLDPTIVATSSNTAYANPDTPNAQTERNQQAVNGRVDMSYKYASFDQSFTLGDRYHLCPDTSASINFNEFGWWSNTLSDGSGNFSPAVTLTTTFSQRGVSSYFVAGDIQRGEYPVNFTVALYDGGVLQFTDTITGNTDIKFSKSFTQVNNIDEARINITKWSHPNRNIKLAEFTTQVIEEYSGETICNFSTIEEREISNDNSIPVGNIASSEASLCLINNQGRQFDANNTSSRLFNIVKPNAKVEIDLGMEINGEIEYIPMFKGWSLGWNVPENSKRASTTARDRLNLMTQTKITNSAVLLNTNIYDWFVNVLSNAGLASIEYNIDTALNTSTFNVPVGWFEQITHRKALEQLAQASGSVVYQDREGIIQVKLINNFPTTAVKEYTRSDYMSKDNQPIYQNVANRINVTTSPLLQSAFGNIYTTNSSDPESIGASTSKTYTIFYTDKPVSGQVPSIQNIVPSGAGVSITGQTHYSWGSVLTVQNTNGASQTFEFTVNGYTYSVSGQKTITQFDQTSIDLNGEQEFNYPENRFLQTSVLADNISTNLLSSFKDPQRDLTLGFSPGSNPSLELGDQIDVKDLYTIEQYGIISQEFDFNGGLSAIVKARKSNIESLTDDDIDNLLDDDFNKLLEG